jgi:hypothetical protein
MFVRRTLRMSSLKKGGQACDPPADDALLADAVDSLGKWWTDREADVRDPLGL